MFYIAFVTREGRHWLAEFPDCPGCQTFAGSQDELARMAKEALEGWLEAHLVDGQVPPAPKAHRRAPARHRAVRVLVDPALAVAVQIRQARARLGLTQAALAKRARVSQQQVAKLERPGENPTIGTLTKVAKALERSLDVELLAAG
jgi:predicted RNase H-like HicB family nuclease/DNA-binding XRE family transcriptional regulator